MTLVVAGVPILAVLALGAAAWAGCRPLPQEAALEGRQKIEELLPLHTQHFPQLRQALDSTDARYVRRKISKNAERMWRTERRQILQRFLSGLAGDFARLNRLRRVIGSLAEQNSGRDEVARAWLGFRFRLGCRMISMQIALGGPRSMRQLARLTELVASLSASAEAAMAELETGPARSEVPSRFSA
jgi:hypothetical protein